MLFYMPDYYRSFISHFISHKKIITAASTFTSPTAIKSLAQTHIYITQKMAWTHDKSFSIYHLTWKIINICYYCLYLEWHLCSNLWLRFNLHWQTYTYSYWLQIQITSKQWSQYASVWSWTSDIRDWWVEFISKYW